MKILQILRSGNYRDLQIVIENTFVQVKWYHCTTADIYYIYISFEVMIKLNVYAAIRKIDFYTINCTWSVHKLLYRKFEHNIFNDIG